MREGKGREGPQGGRPEVTELLALSKKTRTQNVFDLLTLFPWGLGVTPRAWLMLVRRSIPVGHVPSPKSPLKYRKIIF